MSDDTGTEGTNEGTEGQEETFWKKLSDTVDARIDAGVERALQKHFTRKPGTGSRTGGHSTVPSIIADFMFGKPKTGA